MTPDELQRGNSEVVYGLAAYGMALRHVHLNMAPVLIAYWMASQKTGDVLSVAAVAYRKFLVEMALVGLGNVIESSLVDIEREVDASFNVWDEPSYELRYYEQAKMVRALYHIVKHNAGIVRGNSLAGRVLMDQYGAAEGTEVSALPLDVRLVFCHCYIFLLDLLGQVTGVRHPLLDSAESEQVTQIMGLFVPDGA